MKKQQKQQLTALIQHLLLRQWKDKEGSRSSLTITIKGCIKKVRRNLIQDYLSMACWGTSFIMFCAIWASVLAYNPNPMVLGPLVSLVLVCFFGGFMLKPKKLGPQTQSLYNYWVEMGKRIKKLKLYRRIDKSTFWEINVSEETLADFFGYELKRLAEESEKFKNADDLEEFAKMRRIISELYELAKELGFELPTHGSFFELGSPKVYARGKKPH